MIPIIDTHQHLWDLARFRLPWTQRLPALRRSFLPSDYDEAAAGLGIEQAIYMEVDLDPAQQTAEADYVVELCRRDDHRTVAGVISGRPAEESFRDYVTRYRDSTYIKGVRQILHVDATPPGYCLSPEFVAGIRLLGELELSFDVCVRPGELGDAAALVEACPGTRFVLDHCGNADVQAASLDDWQRGMEQVARHERVVCKVSGIVVSARPDWSADDLAPAVNHTLDTFGEDRVMFGGDWPVCTQKASLRQWVEALRAIVAERPASAQRKLFYDNAARFYGLL